MLRAGNTEEGRVIMSGTTPEYQYHLKDHLGNVRLTFTAKDEADTVKADFELANQEAEAAEFESYNPVELDLFDHTDASNVKKYVQHLHGGNNSQVALTRSFSVMPGESIKSK